MVNYTCFTLASKSCYYTNRSGRRRFKWCPINDDCERNWYACHRCGYNNIDDDYSRCSK